MSALTPRDLKDITDLVSRKLEMYLNIDERERQFDPEGCYRVSPRMHKYDVMYRLLESTEFEKSLKSTSTTPRSRSRNNQSETRKEQTPRSRSKNKESKQTEEKSRSRSRNNQSEKRKEQTQRSRSNKQTEEKSRSRSKSAKTPRGQSSSQPKARPKSSTPYEINNKYVEQKPTTSKSVRDSLSKRYQYRPITIKTPRSTNTMVGNKQTKRLEQYANEVYDNHPVQDLQKIHNVCPRIPNNGKVQNYTNHVGAALNTKNYMEFYLKTGLDGSKASPRRKQREITYKGSMSPATSDRRSGYSNQSSNSPQVDSSRAVVTFKSPPSSGTSEANYNVISIREETDPRSSSVTSSADDQIQPYDDVIRQEQPDDDVILPKQLTHGYSDQYAKSPRESGNPGDRCKSRLGRKSSSLNINYNSDSDDLSISRSESERNVDKDTSTRTNSPASKQESLETPSSYQEIDSSDSSSSSVLRYYRLSTGEVYSPRRTKSPKAGKSAVLLEDGTRQRHTPRKSPERQMYVPIDDAKRLRSNRNTLTPRKSPERPKRGSSAQKARRNLDDSSTSASSSDSPRYNLLRPSTRLLNRSSIRSDSVSDESSDTPRSSTPFQPQRSHRPKTSVRRSRDKQLIDLNLTAVLNRERSEMSFTGTDDVFADENASHEIDEFHRTSVNSTSTQSRGICHESDTDSQHSMSKEEYHMLGKNGTTTVRRFSPAPEYGTTVRPDDIVPDCDHRFSPVPPTHSPRFLTTLDSTKENVVTTYSADEAVPILEKNANLNALESSTEDLETPRGEEDILLTMPDRNMNVSTKEPSTDDTETPRGQETTSVPDLDFTTGQQNVSNLAEEFPKSSESDSFPESQVSGSDIEWLSRGSDGYYKDGRGNSRKRSATWRPPSRGSQWEDEQPKSVFSNLKYLPGNHPDERGEYQYLPENRGNSTEKGNSESEPEYYITTEYTPSNNTEGPSQSQEPCGGIPPKSRSKAAINSLSAVTPQSNESRGETGSPVTTGYLSQAEIYKAISNLKELAIDFNKDTDPGPSSEPTSSPSEDVKHYNFLVGSDSSPSDVARGEFISSCPATQSELPVIIKTYKEPSELETSLVYDMQEKTDEFRGRVDAEDLNTDESSNDKENVLDRGLSKDSSFASNLSWSDKYGPGATPQKKDTGSDNAPSQSNDHGHRKHSIEVTKDVSKVVSASEQEASTTFHRGMLDEDVFKNLRRYYTSRKDDQDEPYSKEQRPDIKIEDMMNQLEHLEKAKQMHMNKSSFNSGEECSSIRGDDTDTETSSDHVQAEKQSEQQYSKLIETLIQSAPRMSSDNGSNSGSISSDTDTATTHGDQSVDYSRFPTLASRVMVHTEDTNTTNGVQYSPNPTNILQNEDSNTTNANQCFPCLTTRATVQNEDTPTFTTGTIVHTTDTNATDAVQYSSNLTTRASVQNEDTNIKSSSTEVTTDVVDGGHLKLHQSSFLETALGISGEVTECMGKPKQEMAHLTEKDIIVLKSPCLAVTKKNADQMLDCKSTVPTPKKVNKKILERGKLEARRPRSAAVRSSKSRSSSRRRPSSSVYLSA